MGFYYFSILSLVPLAIAYAVLGLVFLGIARVTRNKTWQKTLLVVLGATFAVLPIAEELWIAWRFGQTCKEAGTFVYRKVQVDGFYDDTRTTHSGAPTPQAASSFDKSGYRFLEMKGPEKYIRLEKIDDQWKTAVIDRPTARYHFKTTDSGTIVSHKILKSQTTVVDNLTGEELARYIRFGRSSAWFYIGLDKPAFACDAPKGWPLTRKSLLIYREVLIPIDKR